MKNSIPLLILLLMCSCAVHQKSGLFGVWKSNEAKTLNYINSLDNIPEKSVAFLSDDFFGHLIVEYKNTEVRAYFDNCEDDYEDQFCIETVCKEMKEFEPYKILEETEQKFIISYFDELEGKIVEETLYREDNCYYVNLKDSKYNLREYFCRTSN